MADSFCPEVMNITELFGSKQFRFSVPEKRRDVYVTDKSE